MTKVFIVGTSHKYQRPDTKSAAEFRVFIGNLCAAKAIVAIAEELSVEALTQGNSIKSVGENVARTMNIVHRYCDMSNAQRMAAGVVGITELRYQAFQNNWGADALASKIRASEEIREQHWLSQIILLGEWPIIFICGACHVPHFQRLLIGKGIKGEIASENWVPRHLDDR